MLRAVVGVVASRYWLLLMAAICSVCLTGCSVLYGLLPGDSRAENDPGTVIIEFRWADTLEPVKGYRIYYVFVERAEYGGGRLIGAGGFRRGAFRAINLTPGRPVDMTVTQIIDRTVSDNPDFKDQFVVPYRDSALYGVWVSMSHEYDHDTPDMEYRVYLEEHVAAGSK